MTMSSVGIVSAARYLPDQTATIAQVLADDSSATPDNTGDMLGISQVHVFTGESPTEMAVAVSRLALENAGLAPTDLDAIIDFSVMPQRYVEPAWSMSNELQAELGAKGAFTLGFSGGGSANLHAALKFARALIRANDDIDTILLAAADQAIPGNRVLSAGDPVTVIGDAASALIVRRDAPSATVIDVAATSKGALHDVFNIPGGGIAHPTRLDLYKLVLDADKYASVDPMAELRDVVDTLLTRNSLTLDDIAHFVTANISRADAQAFQNTMKTNGRLVSGDLDRCGHVHSCDLVFNYLDLQETGAKPGDLVLLASHGMGFFRGATLLKL